MIALLLFALAQRTYHEVPLEQVASTRWTHICTAGPLVYVRKQRDGDWHLTLDNGRAKLVVEIIPAVPLDVPPKGRRIRVCGITRKDAHHGFAEIHPAEWIDVLPKEHP